jgi:hypothetical protein
MSSTTTTTTAPAPASPPERPPPGARRSTRHIVSLVIGGFVGLLAVAFLAGGALSLWANGEKNDDGYLSTRTERLSTNTAALATENLDVDLDGAGWLVDAGTLGKIRLEVASRTGEQVFVGIARTSDVSAYLRGTPHAIVTDIDTSPFRSGFRNSYRTVAGPGSAGAPTAQRIWVASSYGTGTRELTWKVQDGDWSVVVMNADGSPRVDAAVSAGAEAPFLGPLGWGLLGTGFVLLLISGGLVAVGVRGTRRAETTPAA